MTVCPSTKLPVITITNNWLKKEFTIRSVASWRSCLDVQTKVIIFVVSKIVTEVETKVS